MSRRPEPQYLFALDVGTSKVTALVGEVSPEGKLQVVGLGQFFHEFSDTSFHEQARHAVDLRIQGQLFQQQIFERIV